MKHIQISTLAQGQALVALLVFVVIAVMVIFGSIAITSTNTEGATVFQQGIIARQIAETGVENALLKLLRDPSYTGETIPVDEGAYQGSAAVTITGDSLNKTIQSIGTAGNFQHKIVVKITYNNGVQTIISWQDIQ